MPTPDEARRAFRDMFPAGSGDLPVQLASVQLRRGRSTSPSKKSQ